MSSGIKYIDSKDLVNAVFSLKGEQRIFFPVDEELCKQCRYTSFKKQGLENLFLSYMNNTAEEASKLNFDTFAERMAAVATEEADLIQHIGLTTFGSELYRYLTDIATPHSFYVDFENAYVVIYNQDEGIGPLNTCNCSSCTAKRLRS